MRRLLKLINYAAQLMALIFIKEKQINSITGWSLFFSFKSKNWYSWISEEFANLSYLFF